MKRSFSAPAGSRRVRLRARAAAAGESSAPPSTTSTPWSRATRQNESGLNFAGTTTVPPRRERGQRRRHEPVDVEQRHHAERHVARRRARSCARRCRPRSTGWRASAGRASAGRCCRSCAGPARRRRLPAAATGVRPVDAAQAHRARGVHVDRQDRHASPAARARLVGAFGRQEQHLARSCPRGRSGTRLPCRRGSAAPPCRPSTRRETTRSSAGRSAARCRRGRRGPRRRRRAARPRPAPARAAPP